MAENRKLEVLTTSAEDWATSKRKKLEDYEVVRIEAIETPLKDALAVITDYRFAHAPDSHSIHTHYCIGTSLIPQEISSEDLVRFQGSKVKD